MQLEAEFETRRKILNLVKSFVNLRCVENLGFGVGLRLAASLKFVVNLNFATNSNFEN